MNKQSFTNVQAKEQNVFQMAVGEQVVAGENQM